MSSPTKPPEASTSKISSYTKASALKISPTQPPEASTSKISSRTQPTKASALKMSSSVMTKMNGEPIVKKVTKNGAMISGIVVAIVVIVIVILIGKIIVTIERLDQADLDRKSGTNK